MRLTLRNLLAYLHDMMAPGDRAAFSELLAGSPNIAVLLKRCEHVRQEADLPAPALEEAQPLRDADLVAQYLDFALADDIVPRFEKAVLDSSEQLAEVVDCHQVLADVVRHRVANPRPPWRSRLVALVNESAMPQPIAHAQTDRDASTGHARSWNAAEASLGAMNHGFGIERAPEAAVSQSARDLAQYLSDDDEGELSEEAAEVREKVHERETIASAVAGHTPAAHPPLHKQLAAFTSHDPHHGPVEDAISAKRKRRKRRKWPKLSPWMYAAICGVTAASIAGIWLLVAFIVAPSRQEPTGPFFYGVKADSTQATCELTGTVSYEAGGVVTSDPGAMVLSWADDVPAETTLTAQQVESLLSIRRQSANKPHFTIAAADDQGAFRLRMLNHHRFRLLVISRRTQSTAPANRAEVLRALLEHVSDPENLLGERVFQFTTVDMPGSGKTTVHVTFPAAR